ncbi:MAG: alpha/beta hydrolase, partial [archaeon]
MQTLHHISRILLVFLLFGVLIALSESSFTQNGGSFKLVEAAPTGMRATVLVANGSYFCGDNFIHAPNSRGVNEVCDGARTPSCQDLGYFGGTTSCTSTCQRIDQSNCFNPIYTTPTQDIPYGPKSQQVIDFYPPTNPTGPFPVIIYAHSGGFTTGDETILFPNPQVQTYLDNGFGFISIRYRLAPVPGQIVSPDDDMYANAYAMHRDVYDSIKFVKENANDFGINPNWITTYGRSAGAVLLCKAVYDDEWEDLGIAAHVNHIGMTHFPSYTHPTTGAELFGVDKYVDADPQLLIDASCKPMIQNTT